MVQTANVVQLKPRTLEAFEDYIREAEAAMQPSLKGDSAFLWSDSDHQRAQQVRHGKIVAQLWAGDRPVKVPNGLIHDWTGAAFIPNATVEQTLDAGPELRQSQEHLPARGHRLQADQPRRQRLQNLPAPAEEEDHHRRSRHRSRRALLRNRSRPLVLPLLHHAHRRSGGRRHRRRSTCSRPIPVTASCGACIRTGSSTRKATSVAASAASANGVYIECRAISLTRDIPYGLGWIIEPIIRKLPQESLIHTLECTRKALT